MSCINPTPAAYKPALNQVIHYSLLPTGHPPSTAEIVKYPGQIFLTICAVFKVSVNTTTINIVKHTLAAAEILT